MKLIKEQERQIAAAIAELEAIGPGGAGLGGDVWIKVRDAGLLLRDSLNGRPPTLSEARLVRVAEQVLAWHPLRPLLEDLAVGDETRAAVTDWKRRLAAAAGKADVAQAALDAKRNDIIGTVSRGGGFALITADTAEREGLRELELAALRVRAAATEVARAFGEWRLRAWCDGKLRSTKGT